MYFFEELSKILFEFLKDVSGYIKYWHYPSKSCVYTIYDKETEPLVTDFNMNFDIMAVGGYSNQIGLYDVPTKKLIRTLESK